MLCKPSYIHVRRLLPYHFQVWLSLADQYIAELHIDWEKTVKFAFNEKSNPDDNKLGMQIVKVLFSRLISPK